MRALAVVCKISGLGNTIANWTEALIRRYVLDAIEIFGIDRCMFASNFPTDNQFSGMGEIWEAFFLDHERIERRGARQALRRQRDPSLPALDLTARGAKTNGDAP